MGSITEALMKGFAEKELEAFKQELARLSKEGHLVIESTLPNFVMDKNHIMTVSSGLRLTMPKHEQAMEDLAKSQERVAELESKLAKAVGALKTAMRQWYGVSSYSEETDLEIASNPEGELYRETKKTLAEVEG